MWYYCGGFVGNLESALVVEIDRVDFSRRNTRRTDARIEDTVSLIRASVFSFSLASVLCPHFRPPAHRKVQHRASSRLISWAQMLLMLASALLSSISLWMHSNIVQGTTYLFILQNIVLAAVEKSFWVSLRAQSSSLSTLWLLIMSLKYRHGPIFILCSWDLKKYISDLLAQ